MFTVNWAKLADIGLASFARGSVAWEGDHVRLLLLPKDSKGLSKDVVGRETWFPVAEV